MIDRTTGDKNKLLNKTAVKHGGILSKKIFNINGIRFGILLYFMLFSICILVVMWLFQFVFARSYYNNMRHHDVENICDSTMQMITDDNYDVLESVAKTNGFNMYVFNSKYFQCLQGFDSNGQPDKDVSVLRWNTENGALNTEKLKALFDTVKKTEGLKYCEIVTDYDGIDDDDAIVYANVFKQIGDYELMLFVYVPMYSISATMATMTAQLTVVTLTALVLSLVVGGMLSVQLSTSIETMSKYAKVLATGDYSVKFVGNGYTEIDDLSDSLNYATRQLSRSETIRKDVMANVSHDLRTPLTLIKSYAEMIRDLSGDDKKKREKHLNTIIKETESLTAMVNDILKLSKSEQVGGVNKEIYDLSAQVNEIADMMVNGDMKGFSLERDIESNLVVFADKQKISQVIINFLSNAYKYSGDSRFIRITLKAYGDRVRFDVYDNGLGISEEELPYVWDRYTKASLKHKTGDSNGIGLSIVKSIVLQHNGKYGVNSTLGKGSNFYFELPLADKNGKNNLLDKI